MYFITGGNGFIGKNLAEYFAERGKKFAIIDKNSADNKKTLEADLSEGFPTHHVGVTESNTLIHLAANAGVVQSIKYPVKSYMENVASTLNCLEVLRKGWFDRMVFTSSASSSLSLSPYLASKLSCEALCRSYSKSYGLNIQVLKLSNVYGPYSTHKDSVIHTFIKNCIRHRSLAITGDGSQLRDFIYVDDVVESIYFGRSGYISSGKLTSIATLATIIADISKELIDYSPDIINIKSISAEVRSPTNVSDLTNTVNLERGLRLTFKWYVKNYDS